MYKAKINYVVENEDEYLKLNAPHTLHAILNYDTDMVTLAVPIKTNKGKDVMAYLHDFRRYFFQCSGSLGGCYDYGRNKDINSQTFRDFLKCTWYHFSELSQGTKDLIVSCIIVEMLSAINQASEESYKTYFKLIFEEKDKSTIEAFLAVVSDILENYGCLHEKEDLDINDVITFWDKYYIDDPSKYNMDDVIIVKQKFRSDLQDNTLIQVDRTTGKLVPKVAGNNEMYKNGILDVFLNLFKTDACYTNDSVLVIFHKYDLKGCLKEIPKYLQKLIELEEKGLRSTTTEDSITKVNESSTVAYQVKFDDLPGTDKEIFLQRDSLDSYYHFLLNSICAHYECTHNFYNSPREVRLGINYFDIPEGILNSSSDKQVGKTSLFGK